MTWLEILVQNIDNVKTTLSNDGNDSFRILKYGTVIALLMFNDIKYLVLQATWQLEDHAQQKLNELCEELDSAYSRLKDWPLAEDHIYPFPVLRAAAWLAVEKKDYQSICADLMKLYKPPRDLRSSRVPDDRKNTFVQSIAYGNGSTFMMIRYLEQVLMAVKWLVKDATLRTELDDMVTRLMTLSTLALDLPEADTEKYDARVRMAAAFFVQNAGKKTYDKTCALLLAYRKGKLDAVTKRAPPKRAPPKREQPKRGRGEPVPPKREQPKSVSAKCEKPPLQRGIPVGRK